MDAKHSDGGTAFPVPISTPKSQGGMSLRAYIATHAIQVVENNCASMSRDAAAALVGVTPDKFIADSHWPKVIAMYAVAYADALIAELNREP